MDGRGVLELIRVGQSDLGTFGVLRAGAVPFALTLEPPWVGNEAFRSCIPPGHYVCRRIHSPRFGWTYEICHVQDRSAVLFHAGNDLGDTQGCILVGEEFAGSWAAPLLASSRRGFEGFLALLDGRPSFELLIHDDPPVPVRPVLV